MAITQTFCTSCVQELTTATHNFTAGTGNVFKLALFRAASLVTGSYGAATTNYSEMVADEVVGTGYTAGGIVLPSVTPVISGTSVLFDFDDVSWTGASFTASGGLIYNATAGGKAVAVLVFGADKVATPATPFVVSFPALGPSTAILRIAHA